jgi:hypothetical protein
MKIGIFAIIAPLVLSACTSVLPPPSDANLAAAARTKIHNAGSQYDPVPDSTAPVDNTVGITTTPPVDVPTMPPVVVPPVVDPPTPCRSHKGKCKNDNFKNGHYKDKKPKHTKHGRDRKNS